MSRRRVRELELELESCKADVKRERTRVLEREEIIVAYTISIRSYHLMLKTKISSDDRLIVYDVAVQ